ncbi:glycosyltransferase [Gilvimarinus agarilyticus]|uniref:glycosyltransferase n=1 Tax=Gilvimarinus agarilyticus TaxID=679259 RepID=UPI0005A11FD9|nr:glycosyltransferase [Gilvimarinus agarilyticus]
MIHLFNAFHSAHGGSEQETLQLYRLLSQQTTTRLWAASSRGCPTLIGENNARRTRPIPGYLPRGGTYIFVGTHWRGKLWPRLAAPPERLIYVYNTMLPNVLENTAKVPPGWPKPEYVMISDFQRRLLGVPAAIHPSPINLLRFTPAQTRAAGPLRMGRMSRDTSDKHNPLDIALYRDLADEGVEWHLQGAECIASNISHPSVHLTAAGTLGAAEFLRSLDIFYYQTDTAVETFGRVVFEAMACGLPVVCHRHGGYSDWIKHGHNGLLFDNNDEAKALLKRLANDSNERLRLGLAARETVEKMYSESAINERLEFYLAPPRHTLMSQTGS